MGKREKYYTPQEVADLLNLEVLTIYRHIKGGRLRAAKIGRSYRISPGDLKEFLDQAYSEAQPVVEAPKDNEPS